MQLNMSQLRVDASDPKGYVQVTQNLLLFKIIPSKRTYLG